MFLVVLNSVFCCFEWYNFDFLCIVMFFLGRKCDNNMVIFGNKQLIFFDIYIFDSIFL